MEELEEIGKALFFGTIMVGGALFAILLLYAFGVLFFSIIAWITGVPIPYF